MHLRIGDALTEDDCFHKQCTAGGIHYAVDVTQMKKVVAQILEMNEQKSTIVLVYDAMHCTFFNCKKSVAMSKTYVCQVDWAPSLENISGFLRFRVYDSLGGLDSYGNANRTVCAACVARLPFLTAEGGLDLVQQCQTAGTAQKSGTSTGGAPP